MTDEFKEFMVQKDQRDFLEVKNNKENLRVGKDIWMHLMVSDITEKDKVILLKEKSNLSLRNLAVITGISKTKILRYLR